MDEGDLARYDECETLQQEYCVYEISSGGWSNGEAVDDGVLNVAKALGIREWFIATTNFCVSVLSSTEPTIKYA